MNTKLTVLFILIASFVCAQEVNLKGRWKVNCVIERRDTATLHTCDICPTTILANNTAIIEEFELEFTDNGIKIPNEEITLQIPYTFNRKLNEVKFHYKGKDYAFRAMIVADSDVQILMAESGEILYLKRLPK